MASGTFTSVLHASNSYEALKTPYRKKIRTKTQTPSCKQPVDRCTWRLHAMLGKQVNPGFRVISGIFANCELTFQAVMFL